MPHRHVKQSICFTYAEVFYGQDTCYICRLQSKTCRPSMLLNGPITGLVVGCVVSMHRCIFEEVHTGCVSAKLPGKMTSLMQKYKPGSISLFSTEQNPVNLISSFILLHKNASNDVRTTTKKCN